MNKDLNLEKRARYLKNLINEAILNVLKEQEEALQPQQQAVPPPAQPDPQTNLEPTINPEQQETFTIDEMVDKLNILRGAKSLTDPEVFGRLTTFFNNLSEEQKIQLNTFLTDIGKVVVGVQEQEATQGEINQQVPPARTQAAQPPMANKPAPAPAAPVAPTTV
jgi:hypothetical protein